ncbi:exosome complex component RRP41 [Nematocida homosporus]|uniref:exosome complex component RRP41 n=1 Tax=Nematocida homosporus TaxID=1912981 RepID=UPI00221F45E0|nr:exosome complex component RRP41 [Nematocida homosporus]KAI5184542.1 exosome complex component RRP41 [Nematocida homosporus]
MDDANYFECEYNACGRDKGSVLVNYGNSKVLGVLNGPFEPAGPVVDPFRATVRVQIYAGGEKKTSASLLSVYLERLLSASLRMQEYPRCIIEVKLYLLSWSDNYYAALVNTASVLLLSSGLQMFGVPLGIFCSLEGGRECTVGVISKGGVLQEVFYLGTAEEPSKTWKENVPDLLERIRYSLKTNYEAEMGVYANDMAYLKIK